MMKESRLRMFVKRAIVGFMAVYALYVGWYLIGYKPDVFGFKPDVFGRTSPRIEAAPAQAATVTPTVQPEVPPSLCVEGNRCSPDSTGPWDGFCITANDVPMKLVCKGGRLVKRDTK